MPTARRSPLVANTARLAVIVGFTASLFALAAPTASRAASHQVQIAGMAFGPATLTVTAGDTVTWTNDDGRAHTVTASGGAFASGNLDPTQAYSFTFTQPGTYTYACDYHPEMQGTIVVQAASAPTPSPSTGGGGTPGTGGGGGGATPVPAPQAPGGQGGTPPNTAMAPPGSLAWLALLLIGVAVALALGIPHRKLERSDVKAPPPEARR